MAPMNVGIVGCGNISRAYLGNAPRFAQHITYVAVADLNPEAAQAKAEEFNISTVYTVAEMMADPQIDIILNLTIPVAHFDIAMQAVAAGKSVFNEKPLCLTREEGQQMLTAAQAKGVRVGCAPDTVLGGGIQTCRKLIDDGAIGTPMGCAAHMVGHGHESWHPSPDFYYKPGGGPMFDMGPYYLTALVTMMGPVRRVSGATRITFPERTITSQPKAGQKITVEVPTHIVGVMDFANGAVGHIVTSFDVWHAHLPLLQVWGTDGSIMCPDPNSFGGTVQLRRAGDAEWADVPLTHGYAENCRSLGLADMAHAIRNGRDHRANGDLAFHILDLMHAFHDASDQGRHIDLTSQCPRPTAMPSGLADGELDDTLAASPA